MPRQRYSVLAEATVTLEVVVTAESPLDAVRKARFRKDWQQTIGPPPRDMNFYTVLERRKGGKEFRVRYKDGTVVAVLEVGMPF